MRDIRIPGDNLFQLAEELREDANRLLRSAAKLEQAAITCWAQEGQPISLTDTIPDELFDLAINEGIKALVDPYLQTR